MDTRTDRAPLIWTVPQCPFPIEYAPQVLEEIRLAVVDAFFSVPRGGVEIGGVMLGKYQNGRLAIFGHAPVECEHALGPSFNLSAKDHARFADRLAGLRAEGHRPVGWYHSHTRSEIFLSEIDLEVHKRYFPDPWQVALVVKPHTFQPTRAGFFFRDAAGAIHAPSSYREFLLEPAPAGAQPEPVREPESPPRRLSAVPAPPVEPRPEPLRPVPQFAPEPVLPAPEPPRPRDPEPRTQPELRIEPEPERAMPEVAPPAFLQTAPEPSRRGLVIVLALLAGLGIGAGGYQTRESWLPRITPLFTSVSKPAPAPSLGLTTVDADGQLQIRWDRNSPAIRAAVQGTLTLEEGGTPRIILLDSAHLQAGSFTYARQGERVDVSLAVHSTDESSKVREVSTFLGKLPEHKVEDPQAVKKLNDDLDDQRKKNRKLQKTVEDMRTEMQRKRLQNQNPDR